MPASPLKKEVIYIALAGPMSGENKENGEEMLRGVRLYLDKISSHPGFKDKQVEVLVFDDTDKRAAIKIATEIVNENKVFLVLGHYGSTNSAAAGAIYRKNGIPAITASATEGAVTFKNDWYFRIIPDNRFIAGFIAEYMKKALNRTSASIIHEADTYGSSLVRNFETKARELGISIQNKWKIDSKSETSIQELKNIIGQLRASQNLGKLFCAVHASEGAELSASSRYPGTDYPLIGPNSFSTPSFISRFNDYPLEQKSPGYYSDGIYTVSPFLSDIADKEGLAFRQEFIEKYDSEPSWIAASYYDAMNIALRAVENAEIQGQDIRKDRRKIRDALTRFDSSEIAIKGVTGNIYFDKHGNASGSLAVGIWQKHKLFPAFWQYQDMRNNNSSSDVSFHPTQAGDEQQRTYQKLSDDDIIIDEQILTKIRLVYAGIDINRIYNLDTDRGTCTADFYLWFRFQGDFDDTRISFTNAVNPVRLGEPVMEDTAEGNITIRSYRVIADFKNFFDTYAYPFDEQAIQISFRHEDQPETKLIYVPDIPALPEVSLTSSRKEDVGKRLVKPIPGWDIMDMSLFRDAAHIAVPDKQRTLSYSQINAEISVQRKGRIFLFLKSFFFIIVITVLLYVVYLIPHDQLSTRALIFIPSLAATGMVHYLHLKLTPAYKVIEHALFSGYFLAGMSAFISILTHIAHKRSFPGKSSFLVRHAGRIIHISFTLTAWLLIGYLYI